MDAADSQGSPPDRDGGSSSTPPAVGSQSEGIEVDGKRAVLAITPTLVYDMKGEVHVLPANIVKAVDDTKVPDGYRREGCRERSFMYSLGVYVVPSAEEDHKHKYLCMADPLCRKNKTTVPCKKGDRSNVNTHHKSTHRLPGVAGAVKAGKQKQAKGNIQRSFEASKNSCAGTNRCVCMSNCKLKLVLEHIVDGSGQEHAKI